MVNTLMPTQANAVTSRLSTNLCKLVQTSFVRFDDQKGILFFKKKLKNHNHSANQSLIQLIKIYLSGHDQLKCYFLFKDLNMETLKVLFRLFKEIKSLSASKKIEITWFADHQNKDIMETGMDFADMYDININLLSVNR